MGFDDPIMFQLPLGVYIYIFIFFFKKKEYYTLVDSVDIPSNLGDNLDLMIRRYYNIDGHR